MSLKISGQILSSLFNMREIYLLTKSKKTQGHQGKKNSKIKKNRLLRLYMLQYCTYTLKNRTIYSNNIKIIIVIIKNNNNNFTSSKSTIIQFYLRENCRA